jgi:hypothetical protein
MSDIEMRESTDMPLSSKDVQPERRPTIVLFPQGDLTLVIGKVEQQPVRVSRDALRLASPVWNAMLNGNWAESGATEIPFPEDDIEAMMIVLRISHLKYEGVPDPEVMKIGGLYNLAAVCDKYDVLHIVQFVYYMKRWFPRLNHYKRYHPRMPRKELQENMDPRWLFVAWVFGHEHSFKVQAGYLARTAMMNTEGQLMTEFGEMIEKHHVPSDLLERIIETRKATITLLLEHIRALLQALQSDTVCKQDSLSLDAQLGCRSSIFGSFLVELTRIGIVGNGLVIADVEDVTVSVERLNQSLQTVRVLTNAGHKSCGRRFRLAYTSKEIVSAMKSPVSDAHLAHFEKGACE